MIDSSNLRNFDNNNSSSTYWATIRTAKCPVQSYKWEVSFDNGNSYEFLSTHGVLSWGIDDALPSWANFADIRLTVTTTDGNVFYGYHRAEIDSNCGGSNGNIMYKKVAEINDNNIVEDINAYPNPFSNNLNIVLPENGENYSIKIINTASGKIIKSFVETFSGFNEFDLTDLSTGMYIVNINSKSHSQNIKVFKE